MVIVEVEAVGVVVVHQEVVVRGGGEQAAACVELQLITHTAHTGRDGDILLHPARQYQRDHMFTGCGSRCFGHCWCRR